MQYSVKELRDNLSKKLKNLGISEEFLNSPAFRSAIIEIDVLMAQMNMFSVALDVMVTEENGTISFTWNSNYEVKYSLCIKAPDSNSINCIVAEEHAPSLNKSGVYTRTKRVVEKRAVLSDDGNVVLTTNGANVCSTSDVGKSVNRSFVDRKIYDKYGVMKEREFRTYPEMPLNDNIDNLKVDSILYVSRGALERGFMSEKYETRTLMIRNKIDTAKTLIDNRREGKRFMGELQLGNEHGLKNMELIRDFDYPKEVLIKPLSTEEIEALVRRERDSVVAQGLRNYANGREDYYYSSLDDVTFVSEDSVDVNKTLK